MQNKYYPLPVNFGQLIKTGRVKKCSLKESIAQYLHLISTSYPGECYIDQEFGCRIWEYDFDHSMSDGQLKENMRDSLLNAILKNEKRLNDVKVNVKISQVELTAEKKSVRIKKRVDIEVTGKVVLTNEAFSYFEYFYLGPLSYY